MANTETIFQIVHNHAWHDRDKFMEGTQEAWWKEAAKVSNCVICRCACL